MLSKSLATVTLLIALFVPLSVLGAGSLEPEIDARESVMLSYHTSHVPQRHVKRKFLNISPKQGHFGKRGAIEDLTSREPIYSASMGVNVYSSRLPSFRHRPISGGAIKREVDPYLEARVPFKTTIHPPFVNPIRV
ncbi:hypothetical protein BKA70DRAFT_1237527 [Coprinopsis sp. MPI-PUGE-AT-0042]|nr:hypothetical protein BKA70DRAFT_1237527 [Coprinopsis sp. MPI-PUGE-AT-0042]